MTDEQPSSAEALQLAAELREIHDLGGFDDPIIAHILDRFANRVSERWQNRDRQRLEQIDRLQETVQTHQSARAALAKIAEILK
jgi:hypothetical protein